MAGDTRLKERRALASAHKAMGWSHSSRTALAFTFILSLVLLDDVSYSVASLSDDVKRRAQNYSAAGYTLSFPAKEGFLANHRRAPRSRD